jgi:hypothetical protein|tara:strand:+ start:363 stop:608 length:246 start_codon:yes stop_codon:yes gene_type:complete
MKKPIVYRGIVIHKSYLSPTTVKECTTVQGFKVLGHYPSTLRRAKETVDSFLKDYESGNLSKQGRVLVEQAIAKLGSEAAH